MSYPSWNPPDAVPEGAAARLIHDACVDYGGWRLERLDEAKRMLADDPELARTDLYTAAAAGQLDTVQALLADAPALANAAGGPFGWPPLLYACYSRLPPDCGRSTCEVARALLAAGADARAGFLWRGYRPPFTALTGAFGEGEQGNHQPRHPEREVLARALLAAGADPDDEQTLYNCHFYPDDGHLVLLFEYGLSDPRMLAEELWAAARKGFTARVELLLAHDVAVDVPGRRDGRTPAHAAMIFGNHAIAETLIARGARRPVLTAAEQFAAACVAGRADEARALLAQAPELRDGLGPQGRVELLQRAVEARHPDGLRLMAELGFELDVVAGSTPLHDAAWAGDLELCKLLIELGASTTIHDARFDATPLGWAEHNHQHAVADYLRSLP